MTELQNYIDGYGFGISVKDLCSKAYWQMKADGHKVCIVNDRYLELDGKTYFFSKSRKVVANYDRGWDIEPSDPDTELAVEILLHSENY